jgi:hypothetical protein
MSAGTVVFVEEVVAGSELLEEGPRVANPVPNPSFEVDLATWVSIGGTNTRQVASPAFGTASLHVVGTSSGHGVEYRALVVENGRRYYVRVDVTAYTAGPGSASLRISNAANTQKALVSRSSVGLLEVEFVADADATDWKIRLLSNGGAADFNMDGVQFGEIDATGQKIPYVDGTFAGYGWAATAHNSASVELASLYVVDPTDFQPDGGELLVGGTEEKGYSAIDEATGRITLDANLSGSFAEGDRVDTLPLAVERFAHVQLEDQDEVLIARVPHALYDRLPLGARDENVDDAELAELGRAPGGEVIVADVLNREPLVDAGFLDPTTTGSIPHTDGLPPSSSPTPTVRGGVGSLFVTWAPVANVDVAVYEVHISTSSGFTPGVGTYAGETAGTLFVIEKLPGTTNRPAYGTTYFVRLVAKDLDGSATVGTEASGSPVEITGPDIAVGGVVAGKIAANAVTAATLESVLALTSSLLAGTMDAQRVEIGYGQNAGVVDSSFIGIRAFASDGSTQTFRVDAVTGEVYVKGRVDFGSTLADGSGASRLLDSDVLELAQQTATTFMKPAHVQSAARGDSFQSTITVAWPNATQAGNLLIAWLYTRDSDSNADVNSVPSYFTLRDSVEAITVGGTMRLHVYEAPAAAAKSGNVTFGLDASCDEIMLHVAEFSGAQTFDIETENSDNTATASVSSSPTNTTQNDELWLVTVAELADASTEQDVPATPSSFTRYRTNQPDIGTARLTSFWRAVTATGVLAASSALDGSHPWLMIGVAFKAKTAPANLPADRADVVRYWTRDVSGKARPHVTIEDGTALAVVGGKAGEVWSMELVGVSVNLGSMAGHTADTQTVSIPGLAVGDFVLFLNKASPHRMLIIRALPVCATAGQIDVQAFNADTGTVDPGAETFYFLVFHRS